eukprot:CAMPEP_0181226262 /NCGR_PEP_ID=MMETSP1096-20121128/32162_1 /TAXON_ID=156174 ORGANISM="Chrysochromulina ericina, Strain CCMP281" /NCGR_SAMPLE_ID=MMETSP1096 /ASSEMBLY_ACC=CAM_ASM_000453 /LENGTH=75 /DNA_ID=CAMNT_0023319591 /DNA_START=292 /DNA_END=519 /DNA_ORIENTATION=-
MAMGIAAHMCAAATCAPRPALRILYEVHRSPVRSAISSLASSYRLTLITVTARGVRLRPFPRGNGSAEGTVVCTL